MYLDPDPGPGPQHGLNLKRLKTAIPDSKLNAWNQNRNDFDSRQVAPFYDDDIKDDADDDADDDDYYDDDVRQLNAGGRSTGVKRNENFFYALPPKKSNSNFRAKKSFVSNFQKSEMDFTQGLFV